MSVSDVVGACMVFLSAHPILIANYNVFEVKNGIKKKRVDNVFLEAYLYDKSTIRDKKNTQIRSIMDINLCEYKVSHVMWSIRF